MDADKPCHSHFSQDGAFQQASEATLCALSQGPFDHGCRPARAQTDCTHARGTTAYAGQTPKHTRPHCRKQPRTPAAAAGALLKHPLPDNNTTMMTHGGKACQFNVICTVVMTAGCRAGHPPLLNHSKGRHAHAAQIAICRLPGPASATANPSLYRPCKGAVPQNAPQTRPDQPNHQDNLLAV